MGTESVEARLAQLNQAKALVSVDTSYLPQIILGVLPVLLDPEVELRKWVSDFLLSAFSSFQVSTQEKRDLALQLVGQLSQAMQNETSTAIHKGYIQLATLIYPLIFAYVFVKFLTFSNIQGLQILRPKNRGRTLPVSRRAFYPNGIAPRKEFVYAALNLRNEYFYVRPIPRRILGFVFCIVTKLIRSS